MYGMELHGRRLFTVSTICCCLCLSATFCATKEAESQSQKSSWKPMVYLDIPRWEERTTYPRLVEFREQFRRRVDAGVKVKNHEIPSATNEDPITLPNDNKDSLKTASVYTPETTEFSGELVADHNDIPTSSNTEHINPNGKPETEKSSLEYVQGQYLSNSGDGANKYFFTSNQKHMINFPKDKINPYNRLQIQKDETGNITGSHSGTNSSTEVDSAEVANRNDAFGQSFIQPSDFPEKYAVETFNLAMKIIKLSDWDDQNAVFSPFSMATSLSMLLLGSEGKTFEELSAQLSKQGSINFNTDIKYHEAFQRLLKYLRSSSGTGVTLSIASEIFVHKRFPIEASFRNELQKFYDTPVESIDFEKEGEQFKNRVNSWVQEKTFNKIKSILDTPPPETTAMGFINAVYFKGPWEIPFPNEKYTKWKDFHVQPNETMKVQMMVNIINVPYVERESYRMIVLPYKQNKTGFFVILPKGNDGINDLKNVERLLTRQELKESMKGKKTAEVTVSLPKMKFSSDGHVQSILESMGLSTMFDPAGANFSRISTDRVYLSSIFHRAVIEVNEVGTEAAAATLGFGDRIIDNLPIHFACDKPFIFFIYHIDADTILFWGRVTRPSFI